MCHLHVRHELQEFEGLGGRCLGDGSVLHGHGPAGHQRNTVASALGSRSGRPRGDPEWRLKHLLFTGHMSDRPDVGFQMFGPIVSLVESAFEVSDPAQATMLPHWRHQHPCHECDCQQPAYRHVACPEGKSFKLLKEDPQQFIYVSPSEAALDKRSSHPLFAIPGVSTSLVRNDNLHMLYSRGVANHLAGSLLSYLCWYDWPRRQRVSPSTRLSKLFGRIREIYQAFQITSRLTNLRPSMVWDISSPHEISMPGG